MKICHVITRMIVGGAQENTLCSCLGALRQGHDVTLVTGPSPGPEGKLLQEDCPSGLKLVLIPDLVREISPWRDWRAYRALRRLFRQQRFDVVHTHASKAGIIGRLAAWKERVPYVVHTVHGNAFGPYEKAWKNWLYVRLEHLAACHCHRIYAVAQAMIDQCVACGVAPAEKYKVVYSGMDLRSFMEAKREEKLASSLGIPAESPVVGVIARLFPLKGHDVLIQAAPELVRRFPGIRFLFVGDGILRGEYERRVQDLGLRRNFVFAGLVRPEEVCRYTALMTVVAHFSLREGLPRAVVQGLASGVPAVAYPLDGTPEVVLPGRTGFLAEVNREDSIVECISALLLDEKKRREMGKTGQAMVLEKFDGQRMSDILLEDYQGFLNPK